jgi:serine/threonine protein kinase/tetratricopeptide (TPR) repeat protein
VKGRHHGPRVLAEDGGVPEKIARYVVMSVLGAGGMGTVYAAFDPVLERKVALKVVRLRATAWQDVETARRRLLREGQALASLAHPNVVPVFDVGSFRASITEPARGAGPGQTIDAASPEAASGPEPTTRVLRDVDAGAEPHAHDSVLARAATREDVFIAMELVEGTTLARWQSRARRPEAVLEVLIAAGRGLAAAHAAGIVHGDFKPGNVLVADDGRILVADFGLARPTAAARASSSGASSSGYFSAEPLDTLTHVLGTPGYMAPEQYRGVVGPAADQFAFCVTAWNALYGAHPFASAEEALDPGARIRAARRPAEPPPRSGVPAWVGRTLRRGLAAEPGDRFASMDELLDRLQAHARPRRRLVLAIATLAVLAGIGTVSRLAHAPSPCEVPVDALAAIDGAATLDALARTVPADAPAWRTDALAHVHADLKAWSAAWRDAWVQSCAVDRATAALALADDRRACLDRRRRGAEAVVDVLVHGDADVWMHAGDAVARLPAPAGCLQANRERPDGGGDAEANAVVEALVMRARAHHAAGRHADALALAHQAELEARRGGADEPLRLDARLAQAEAAIELGRPNDAAPRLEEIAWGAAGLGRPDLALQAMISLVTLEGVDRADHDAGLLWGRRATELLSRDAADPESEAALHNALGLVLQARGDYAPAIEHMRRAHELSQQPGVVPLRRATVLGNLGNVLLEVGDPQATEMLRRALVLREEQLGLHHPDIAVGANNLGLALLARHEPEAARDLFERAIAITEASHGTEHPRLTSYLNNLANVAYDRGDLEHARPLYERTLALVQRDLGEDHPSTLLVAGNLGLVLRQAGELEAALALQRDVLVRAERALPAGHANIGMVENNLAGVLVSLGKDDEARTHYERALQIRQAALGPEHRLVATTLDNLGRLATERGDFDEALARHGDAFAIWHAAHGPAHPRVATALTGLAAALVRRGDAEAGARLATHAIALLESTEDDDPIDLARARLAHAEARASAGSRVEARSLAHAAADVLRARGDTSPGERRLAETLAG